MSAVRPGPAVWNQSIAKIYNLLEQLFPGNPTKARNAALVLNEVVHDFSKNDKFTEKRGILYWIVKDTANNRTYTYRSGSDPSTWLSGGNYNPPRPPGTKTILETIPSEVMKTGRFLYKEQIIAGLLKCMLGSASMDNLDTMLRSNKSRAELINDANIFGNPGDSPSAAQQRALLLREIVYPSGCTPNMDHSSSDLAASHMAAVQSNILPKLRQTSAVAAAAAASAGTVGPSDILQDLIESKKFAPNSGCVLVATMDCVPKSIHEAWGRIKSLGFDLALVFSENATALGDPGTGHLVRKTRLRPGQFNARECNAPPGGGRAQNYDGSWNLSGARTYRFYSSPYNVQTFLKTIYASGADGLVGDHRVEIKTFCFPPGDPANGTVNTNTDAGSQTAGQCKDVIAPGTASADTPFSRTNIMLREGFTFKDPTKKFLPDVENWGAGGSSEQDFLGFHKKKGGDENQALTPLVVAKEPDDRLKLPADCRSRWQNPPEPAASSDVWIQIQSASSVGTIRIGPAGGIKEYYVKSALNLRQLYKEKLALYAFFTIDILAFIRAITSYVPAFLSTVKKNAGALPDGQSGGMVSEEGAGSQPEVQAPYQPGDDEVELLFAFIPQNYDHDVGNSDPSGIPKLPGVFYARAEDSDVFHRMDIADQSDVDQVVKYLQVVSLGVGCTYDVEPSSETRSASGSAAAAFVAPPFSLVSPDRESESSEQYMETQRRMPPDRGADPNADTLDPRTVSPLFNEQLEDKDDSDREPGGFDTTTRMLFQGQSLSGGPSNSGGPSVSGQTGDLVPVPAQPMAADQNDDTGPSSPTPNIEVSSAQGSPGAAALSSAEGSAGQVSPVSGTDRGPSSGSSPAPKKSRTQEGGRTKKRRKTRNKKNSLSKRSRGKKKGKKTKKSRLSKNRKPSRRLKNKKL